MHTFFSHFIDDQLLQHIADQTNTYASQHPYHQGNFQWKDTSVDELRSFFGLFNATGLVPLSTLEDYWEVDSILAL